MPAPAGITMVFDENITKVTFGNYEWSTSGETQADIGVNWSGTYTVTLKNGYIIDTVTSTLNISNITDTTFDIVNADITITPTVTITSKKSGGVLV